MEELSRRTLLKSAAVGATTITLAGVLSACSSSSQNDTGTGTENTANDKQAADSQTSADTSSDFLNPTTAPNPATASNFDIVPESETVVGTTYENLISAITGETGARAKYQAFSEAATNQGFSDVARLFACTADAENIHISLEYELAKSIDPSTELPEAPTVQTYNSDINLILGANGEIYETSDMYPSFIAKAQEEGNDDAVQVFSRAKLAEAYHAQNYLDIYNTIDTPTGEKYYLCPICGYIHMGENFSACPICLSPKSTFTAY